MRILLVGAGGVGDAIAKIAARRDFFELLVVSDYDVIARGAHGRLDRARSTATQGGRFVATQIDASDPDVVASVAREHGATHVMNAVEPKFVPTIFAGALAAGADYLDMAMSLSEPHPTDPYTETGVKLGDDQFAQAPDWEAAGRLALVGMGVEPGLSDVFARYAADHLFSEIDELGVRDGANLVVTRRGGQRDLRPSFSIWTTIEECLNPPVIWEKDSGLVHDAAVLASPRSSTSPRASARSSASTSSTRRCSSCRAGSTRSASPSSTASATSSSAC